MSFGIRDIVEGGAERGLLGRGIVRMQPVKLAVEELPVRGSRDT